MKLSIITINYNNLAGLRKTLASVLSQTYTAFEHIIIDGGSEDGSAAYIASYADEAREKGISVRWVSEPDHGIYNAMNKGIRMATGDYIQILNSADLLASDDVVERMLKALEEKGYPTILYGNMIKVASDGHVVGKSCETAYSFRQFYAATLNHDCCYIKRSLFEEYGLYDESLKIVSDWKWFMQAIGLGKVNPVYVDVDVTLFDVNGVSETNLALRNAERRQVLEDIVPPALLADYDKHNFDMEQMNRLRRHKWAYKLMWFIERCLFKLEKWKRKNEVLCHYSTLQ